MLDGSGPRLRETPWLWLAEQTEGVLYELVDDGDFGDRRLDEVFLKVYRLPVQQFTNHLDDETADAVAIDCPCSEISHQEFTQILRDCRRVLRPGGYVAFCAAHTWWYPHAIRRLATKWNPTKQKQLTLGIRGTERRLSEAGFVEVRCYLGDGTATELKSLVPPINASLRKLAQQKGLQNTRKMVRTLLTRAGLGFIFFRSILVICYR